MVSSMPPCTQYHIIDDMTTTNSFTFNKTTFKNTSNVEICFDFLHQESD